MQLIDPLSRRDDAGVEEHPNMSKVLILGANGQVARRAIELFLEQTDVTLTLYLRNARRLRHLESDRVRSLTRLGSPGRHDALVTQDASALDSLAADLYAEATENTPCHVN